MSKYHLIQLNLPHVPHQNYQNWITNIFLKRKKILKTKANKQKNKTRANNTHTRT